MAPRAKNPLGYLLLHGVEDTQEGIFMLTFNSLLQFLIYKKDRS